MKIDGENDYIIKVDLKKNLPMVTPPMINRAIKENISIEDVPTKTEYQSTTTGIAGGLKGDPERVFSRI